MKFLAAGLNREVSDCNRYEITAVENTAGKKFYNARLIATRKHIEASYDKKLVIQACKRHAAKQLAIAV